MKVLEHFVRTTPVVEKCDDPRCFFRLVIVPKGELGKPKDAPPTSYRVTMGALVNNCLKPVASTLPLATDEIQKLHGKRFFLKLDAMHAFWAIPLCEESKKLMAFQTHEGVFASHGVASPWAVVLRARSNKRRTTTLWINLRLLNTATASLCLQMTWRQEQIS
jgi:hypothetical protein